MYITCVSAYDGLSVQKLFHSDVITFAVVARDVVA